MDPRAGVGTRRELRELDSPKRAWYSCNCREQWPCPCSETLARCLSVELGGIIPFGLSRDARSLDFYTQSFSFFTNAKRAKSKALLQGGKLGLPAVGLASPISSLQLAVGTSDFTNQSQLCHPCLGH